MMNRMIFIVVMLLFAVSSVSSALYIEDTVLLVEFEGDYSDSSPTNASFYGLFAIAGEDFVPGIVNDSWYKTSGRIQSNEAFDLGDTWSLSLWLKWDATNKRFIGLSDVSGSTTRYLLGVNSGGGLDTYVCNAGVRSLDSNLYSASEWYHVVLTWDGLQPTAYINGSVVSSGMTGSTNYCSGDLWGSDSRFVIGGLNGTNSASSNGYIDQVILFDSVIDSVDVSFLYNNGSGIALSSAPASIENVSVNLSESTVLIDTSVNFSAIVEPEGVDVASYYWDFDDSSNSSNASGSVSFSSAGLYNISVNVTDSYGNSSIGFASLLVTAPVEESNNTSNATIVLAPFEFDEATLAFIIGVLIVVSALWMGLRFHPVFFSFAGLVVGALTLFASGSLIEESIITFLLYAFSVMLLLTGFVASMFKK